MKLELKSWLHTGSSTSSRGTAMRYRWLFRPLHIAGACLCEEKAKTWPVYTRKDLEKHKTVEDRIFVSYKTGVYDITDFIVSHPGGQGKILLAAGKSIDPFWRIYQQHFRQGSEALNILERYRVGSLLCLFYFFPNFWLIFGRL